MTFTARKAWKFAENAERTAVARSLYATEDDPEWVRHVEGSELGS